MSISKIIPLINTNDLDSVKAFYTEHFGFKPTFDAPEFLGLKSIQPPGLEIGFMRPKENTCPVFNGKGVTLCLEVADVDKEYERLVSEGVRPEGPPRDNPWGDRSFQVCDPAGVALYINKPIPPAPDFEKYFKE
jgi:predicted enzyme related to lactoylglutathione lyase